MIASLAAFILLSGPLQSDGERPVVILISTNDTGFVHPLDTAERTGDLWRGELIAIQSLSEDFSVVRRDMTLEIDCTQSRARWLEARAYGHHGLLPEQNSELDLEAWETIDTEAWPTLQILHAIACQPIDLSGQALPLAEAEERVRARINDY